jgi:hypothetical protein
MNYVQEIADKFLESSKSGGSLGPADFTLIAEWEKQEIPKEVVIDAIGTLCDADVRSLAEMHSEVKHYFVMWLQSQRAAEI